MKEKPNLSKEKIIYKSVSKGEELFERKKHMLAGKTEQCRRLEEDVKAFDEKAKIEKKTTFLSGRLVWSMYQEVRKVSKEIKDRSLVAKRPFEELVSQRKIL